MRYSIGQISELMEVAPSTLRYYDKVGLLPDLARSASGVRVFDDSDLEWLRMIECLKNSGLSIKEIKQFVDWLQEGDSTINQRQELFHARKRALQEEMKTLQRTLDYVSYKCWFYDLAAETGSTDEPHRLEKEGLPPEAQELWDRIHEE